MFDKRGEILKSQVSVEYLMIIGFVTLITIPLVIIYYSFTQESGDNINSAQIQQIVRKVVDASESVYYLGEPSQTTLKVNIPANIVSVSLSSNEVAFKINTAAGKSDIAQSSSVNITGSLPTNKGMYTITIKAKSDYVEVSYK